MLSAIIPAHNEELGINTCLASLAGQKTRHPFEVIVVDNGSRDTTAATVLSYNHKLNIRLVRETTVGRGVARNTGARMAKGDILIFLDADNRVRSDFIETVFQKAYIDGYEAGTFRTLPIEA